MSYPLFMAVIVVLVGATTPLALVRADGLGTLAHAGVPYSERGSHWVANGGIAVLAAAAFVGAMLTT